MSESAKTIPEGYHSINPYLVVRNAARAIEFYKKAFSDAYIVIAYSISRKV